MASGEDIPSSYRALGHPRAVSLFLAMMSVPSYLDRDLQIRLMGRVPTAQDGGND